VGCPAGACRTASARRSGDAPCTGAEHLGWLVRKGRLPAAKRGRRWFATVAAVERYRQEFEYKRHGTLRPIINFDIVTGQVLAPSIGQTRTEADFTAHIAQTVATDPQAVWVFVTDQRNTDQSESLVRLVAELCELPDALGSKGEAGILHTMATRAAFLSDPTDRIQFVTVPKHTWWLNQVEIWLSIVVRRVIKRGNFISVDDLRAKILAFISYFNQTAKPFRWTYTGRPLVA
jgi:hypothetical protein